MSFSLPASVPLPQALAQGIIAFLYFILAVFEGNNRVLRVIDSRRTVVLVRTAQYFATQNYGTTAQKHLSGIQQQQNQQLQQQRRGSSQMGSRSGGISGGLELQPLVTDNRFLLGIIATMTGVLRSAYVLAVLFMGDGRNASSDENNSSTSSSSFSHTESLFLGGHTSFFLNERAHSATTTSITSESVATDFITIPLAILSYALVLAVLFAHRDLMTKIRRAYDPTLLPPPLPTNQQQHQLGQNETNNHNTRRRSSGDNNNTTTPGTITFTPTSGGGAGPSASSSSSRGLTPAARGISPQHQKILANQQKQKNASFPSQPPTANGDSSKTPLLENSNNSKNNSVTVLVPNSNNNSNAVLNTSRSDENLAATAGGGDENNNNNSNGSKSFTLSDFYVNILRPYRAFLTMIFIGVVLIVSLIIEAVTGNVRISEYCSPIISLILGVWSLYSFVESYVRLRFFGAASRRVIVAILILTIYLLGRGIIVLPPVQSKLCYDDGENYWSCFFVYSSVDAVGLLISMLVLP